MMGAKTVYIEVFDRIDRGTIAGELCYPFTDKFIGEWEEMKQVYKKIGKNIFSHLIQEHEGLSI